VVSICRPDIMTISRGRRYCSTCKVNRNFCDWFQDWYGWTITCLACGDSWQDGERMERPFMRGWRKESIEHAKKMLDNRTEDQHPSKFRRELHKRLRYL